MKMSISIEKGGGSIKHNFDEKYRNKQKHVVGDSHRNIVLLNDEIEDVYNELFEKSKNEYNLKQKRHDRKIENYYDHIKEGKQEKLFQEVIITIGNIENKDEETIIVEVYKRILPLIREKYRNLRFFGAVIHLDESGIAHMHLDFVPFITNSKRGLSTRVSMDGALKEMGFKPEVSRLNLKNKRPIIFNGFRNDIETVIEKVMKDFQIEHIDKYDNHNKMYPKEFREYKAIETKIKESIELLSVQEERLSSRIGDLKKESSKLESTNMLKQNYLNDLIQREALGNAKMEMIELDIANLLLKKSTIEQEMINTEKNTEKLENEKRIVAGNIKDLREDNSTLEKEKERLTEGIKNIKLSKKQLNEIVVRQSKLDSREIIINTDDFRKLKNNEIRLIDKNNDLVARNHYLEDSNKELSTSNDELYSKNTNLVGINEVLENDNQIMQTFISGKGMEEEYKEAKPILAKLIAVIKEPFNYIEQQYHKIVENLKKLGLNIKLEIDSSKFRHYKGLENLEHKKTYISHGSNVVQKQNEQNKT